MAIAQIVPRNMCKNHAYPIEGLKEIKVEQIKKQNYNVLIAQTGGVHASKGGAIHLMRFYTPSMFTLRKLQLQTRNFGGNFDSKVKIYFLKIGERYSLMRD